MRCLLRKEGLLTLLILTGLIGLSNQIAYGDTSRVQNRFDLLSDSKIGNISINKIGFTITDTSQPLGSIGLQFCEESPLPGNPCTTPSGFNASGAVLQPQNETGNTGFSIASNSTINTIILTRSPSTPNGSPNTYELDNIVNPSSQGTYYLRIYTYPSTDGSGPYTQFGGVALATASGVQVNAIVPPYIKLCAGLQIERYDCSTATSYLINFGDFSSSQSSMATSQFTVATNSKSGYSVYITGPSLTAGNNVIPNLPSPAPSLIGASQFGINLRANNNPNIGADVIGPGSGLVSYNYNQPNRFTYNDGDKLVTALNNSDNQTFTVTYLTNVSNKQPAGVYATTLTYVCVANF